MKNKQQPKYTTASEIEKQLEIIKRMENMSFDEISDFIDKNKELFNNSVICSTDAQGLNFKNQEEIEIQILANQIANAVNAKRSKKKNDLVVENSEDDAVKMLVEAMNRKRGR